MCPWFICQTFILGYQIIISLVSFMGPLKFPKKSLQTGHKNRAGPWPRSIRKNPHDPSLCEVPPDRQQAFALCRSWGTKAMPSRGGFLMGDPPVPMVGASPRLSHGLMSP